MRMKPLAFLLALSTLSLVAQDVVRLGNLKFAHYGAVSYMKELAPKYNLKIDERMFAKGIDINPAIVAGEIDASAAALDAAIAGRAAGVPIYVVAGFARGGARIVVGANSGIKSLEGTQGQESGRGARRGAGSCCCWRNWPRPASPGRTGPARTCRCSTCPSPI